MISIPFLWMQTRETDDGYFHLLRMIGLDNAIEKSSFPYLVFPYYHNNWGYSMTAFYQPIVTYIPYVLGIISGTFMNGLKIFATLTNILSGIFMYNFIYEVTKKRGIAFFSAVIYMIFPYRFVNIYQRYAMGEFTAFVFMPIVFQGLYNLLQGDKKRHYYITIGGAGLLLSHSISTVYTVIFCLIYVLFNLKLFLKKDIIIKCIINIVFILAISSLFILPMLEFTQATEYAIFEPSIMQTNSSHMAKYALEPWQLLVNKSEEIKTFALGIPVILMLFLSPFVYKKIDKKHKDFYITSIIFGIISLMMSTTLFPWAIMPKFLCVLQFPWRMLGFAMLFLSPVCRINTYYLIKSIKKKDTKDLVCIIIFTLLIVSTVKQLSYYTVQNPNVDKLMEQAIIQKQKIPYTIMNKDYMPLKARKHTEDYLVDRGDTTKLISGQAIIENEYKDALNMKIEIKETTKGTELELPYLFYPGYTVTLENESEIILLDTQESEYGFLKIVIPEDIESGKISVNYTATTLDKVAYIISLVSVMIFILYVINYRRRIVFLTKKIT